MRRMAYDRCGLGWSSRCRTARTPGNIAPRIAPDDRSRWPQATLHSGGTFLWRACDAPLRAALSRRCRRRCAYRSHALRVLAATQSLKAIAARFGPKVNPLRHARRRLRIGAVAGQFVVLPRQPPLRPDCRSRRRAETPRSDANQDRSEKDAAKSVAGSCGALVAPRFLRWNSQPHCFHSRFRHGDECSRANSGHPRYRADAGQLTPLSQEDLHRIGNSSASGHSLTIANTGFISMNPIW